MITQTLRLDVVPGGITTVVHVKQYQTDESLVFNLFSRFGDFEISANFTECTVRGTKSDGNGYSANATCDPSNNSVTVQLTEQMTAVAGRQPYELTVTDSTGRMITTTFILDVHRAALDADTVESESVIKEVQTIVEEYIEENPGLFVVDPTLTQSGEAADAKVTGDEIADLKSAISGGVGIPSDVKEALLDCIAHIGAWSDGNGQAYYDALEAALYPPAELVSISAVYTQTGNVYPDDSLDSLKDDLVVTANYADSTSETITAYLLSGTLTEGTSTITVTYDGKTTTFNVTVSVATTHTISYANGDFSYQNTDTVSAAYDENGTDITSEFAGGTCHFYQTVTVSSNVTMDVNITVTKVYRKTFAGSYDRATKTVRNAVVISNNPTSAGDHSFTVNVLQGQGLGIFNFSSVASITAAEATWME